MKLLVMSGGRHPYEESTPILRDFLGAAGHQVTVAEDASILSNASAMGTCLCCCSGITGRVFVPPGFQQIVLNGVDWVTTG